MQNLAKGCKRHIWKPCLVYVRYISMHKFVWAGHTNHLIRLTNGRVWHSHQQQQLWQRAPPDKMWGLGNVWREAWIKNGEVDEMSQFHPNSVWEKNRSGFAMFGCSKVEQKETASPSVGSSWRVFLRPKLGGATESHIATSNREQQGPRLILVPGITTWAYSNTKSNL